MNINYKQPQFELFPANSASMDEVNKPKFLLANLTLSIESLVILTILGIMVALFSFSLGVERGKQVAAQAIDEQHASTAWTAATRSVVAQKPAVKAVAAASAIAPAATAPVQNRAGNGGFINKTTAKPAPVQPVVKPAAAAVPQTKPAGRLTIQTASYKSETWAKQEAMALKAKGLPSFLIKKGDFWLVCVGHFSSTKAANSALKKIQSKYRGSSVRRF